MGTNTARLHSTMRKAFILALLVALVAMPMAFAGTGFCRAMPCCPPHLAANQASIQHPDCCDTTSCDQPPAAAGDFTGAKETPAPAPAVTVVVATLVPFPIALEPAPACSDASPPQALPPLQRRIALLSFLLI